MKALVYVAPERMEIQEISEPGAREGEVLLGVSAAGVCGSDTQRFLGHSERRKPGLSLLRGRRGWTKTRLCTEKPLRLHESSNSIRSWLSSPLRRSRANLVSEELLGRSFVHIHRVDPGDSGDTRRTRKGSHDSGDGRS